jgi:DNA-binding NarL/FixJ family response regulator
MSIKVFLADGNDVMRPVIAKVLKDEPGVELVGEATSFAETIQMTAALKPDVLLLELHFDDEREYPAEVVKAKVLWHAKCALAISLWNDAEAMLYRRNKFRVKLLDERIRPVFNLTRSNTRSSLIPSHDGEWRTLK